MRSGLFRREAWLIVAVALVGLTTGAGAVYEQSFDLEDFHPRIEERDESVWLVTWDGADVDAPPGSPSLPWLTLRVALPADETVLDVELIPDEERTLGPGVVLAPAPRIERGGVVAVEPDAIAYDRSAWLPGSEPSASTIGFLRGYRIVSVRVAPASYRASTGELRVADRFRVRLQTGPATGSVAPLRSLRPAAGAAGARDRIAERVDWVLAAAPSAFDVPLRRPLDEPVFRPSRRPSLTGSPVDMVIVTDTLFVDEFQAFADWKTTTGTRTVVRSIQWVVANYEAPDRAARIRRFLQDAYAQWGIRFAILGGDSDIVPVRYVRSFHQAPGGIDIACDYYYACLDGDWNADGDAVIGEATTDEVDLEPDIYTGRMPVSTEAEAALLVSKAMWYAGSDPAHFDATYQKTVSFWSEILFWAGGGGTWPGTCSSITFDGADLADWTYHNFMPESFQGNTNMLFEAPACWPDTAYVPQLESKSSVVADFNSGRNYVCHIGHGFRNVMAVGAAPEKLSNGDADAFTNGDRLSILYAVNCNSGAVDFDCIGEHFMKNDRVNGSGGAAGVIAATDLDYPATSQHHLYFFFDKVLTGELRSLGEAFHESNRLRFAANAASGDNSWRWTLYSLIVLGDPSLPLWSETPDGFSVPSDPFYVMGSGGYRVTVWREGTSDPVEGAQVTVYKDGEFFATGLADASGELLVDVQAETPGEMTVAVTGQNFVPFIKTVTVSSPSLSPYLVVGEPAVSDLAGNANGRADRGEDVSVLFPVSNEGGQDATSVTIEVSTSSPFASIPSGSAPVGTVAAGGQTSSDLVTIQIAAALPDSLGYVDLPIDVSVTSDQGSAARSTVLRVNNPRLDHIGLALTEIGDGDGVLEPSESGELVATVLNHGQGALVGGKVELATVDPGLATISVGEVDIDPQPGVPASSPALRFDVVATGDFTFDVTYRDDVGTLLTRRVDLAPPAPPADLWPNGGPGRIRINWTPSEDADVLGYNLYRLDEPSPAAAVNSAPIIGGFHTDLDLEPLTAYRFMVTAVDSSGNEGAYSDTIDASTSPPATTGFPLTLTAGVNRTSPTVLDLDQDGGVHEVVFGSDYIYALHGDGSDYIDGDAQPFTVGIFAEDGHVFNETTLLFWAKPAVADLDLDGTYEIVATHFRTGEVLCWDAMTGDLEWGGATHDIGELCWSSPAVANIDDDPELEVVFWSGSYRPADPFRGCLIGFNHDGSEVVDGDDDPTTLGVLWASPSEDSEYNYGSVALADVDGDQRAEIVAGEKIGVDGVVHLLEYTGSAFEEMAGWPHDPPGGETQFNSSPAVADVTGDSQYEFFAISRRSLVGLDITGTPLPGYPKDYVQSATSDFNDFLPSPVIGDFDGDGDLDVIHGWHSGQIFAYTAGTGEPLAGWPVTFDILGQNFDKAFLNGALANVDGDPEPEFVIGTGGGSIYAINSDGSLVGGFPFEFGGSLFGAPAIWDIDQNGSTDLFVVGGSTSAVSLEFTGVPWLYATSPWPQFRHDPRNSGTYASGLGPTPIDLGSVQLVSTGPSRVEIRWRAVGTYFAFDIDRSIAGGVRERAGSVDGAGSGDRYAFTDRSAPGGRFARYWVIGHTPNGLEEVGPFGVKVQGAPSVTLLHQNAPNPFSPLTTIAYDVGGETDGETRVPVRLAIFDVQGRQVALLVDRSQAPGTYRVRWDGRDRDGLSLSPGIYLYRLTVGERELTRKLVLAR